MLKKLVLGSLAAYTVFGGTYTPATPAPNSRASCHATDAYPPNATRALPWYTINLDDAPEDRFKQVTLDFKEQLVSLIDFLFDYPVVDLVLQRDIMRAIDKNQDAILDSMGSDYGDEIRGIAEVSGVALDRLTFMNAAYEVMGFCTSIVAQNSDGTLFHGRNLDFGLYPGVNWTDVQWGLTQHLDPCLFNAEFQKGGETVWKGVYYAGYVGALTGVKKNGFTVSVNTRFDSNMDSYLIGFLNDPTSDANKGMQWLTMTTRRGLENVDTFSDARSMFVNTPMIAPAYIIMGGSMKNEGSILTFGPNNTLSVQLDIEDAVNQGANNEPWFVLQTNYDFWEQPPFYDDRRYPGEACMDMYGPDGFGIPEMYNVLNGKPNRNRLTTYTAVLQCSTGHLEAYHQSCTDPDCIPW